jgi:anti-sigma regulatory factor (Ser/Thr protein kinase)
MKIRDINERRLDMFFEPTLENADMARKAVTGACTEIGTEAFTEELGLAITEAINSAVENSDTGKVELALMLGKGAVRLELVSSGEKFDAAADMITLASSEGSELAETGFGVEIVNKLFDSVRVEKKGTKTAMIFKKNINTAEEEA